MNDLDTWPILQDMGISHVTKKSHDQPKLGSHAAVYLYSEPRCSMGGPHTPEVDHIEPD